jgi:hypothetical protein
LRNDPIILNFHQKPEKKFDKKIINEKRFLGNNYSTSLINIGKRLSKLMLERDDLGLTWKSPDYLNDLNGEKIRKLY